MPEPGKKIRLRVGSGGREAIVEAVDPVTGAVKLAGQSGFIPPEEIEEEKPTAPPASAKPSQNGIESALLSLETSLVSDLTDQECLDTVESALLSFAGNPDGKVRLQARVALRAFHRLRYEE